MPSEQAACLILNTGTPGMCWLSFATPRLTLANHAAAKLSAFEPSAKQTQVRPWRTRYLLVTPDRSCRPKTRPTKRWTLPLDDIVGASQRRIVKGQALLMLSARPSFVKDCHCGGSEAVVLNQRILLFEIICNQPDHFIKAQFWRHAESHLVWQKLTQGYQGLDDAIAATSGADAIGHRRLVIDGGMAARESFTYA